MTRIILVLLSIAFLHSAAAAETIDVLVSERAAEFYGAEMPDNGNFIVSMQTDTQSQAIVISDYWMDKRTGQFIANLVTNNGSTQRISGAATLTIPVPVPTRRVMPDEILSNADLQIISLPYRRVGAFAVTDLKDLTGMQVKRVLALGRPVMIQSVTPPIIIDRGDRVSIKFSSGALSLAAPGKAISSAYLNQDVRVVNLVSNKTIIGIARENGVVEVFN